MQSITLESDKGIEKKVRQDHKEETLGVKGKALLARVRRAWDLGRKQRAESWVIWKECS